jgi:hypothetical protein
VVLETDAQIISAGGSSSRRWPPGLGTSARWAGWSLLVLLLFVAAWRQARQNGVQSDGASNALQAWQMLHGNLLLRGWHVTDVSFYTTELPLLMLIEAVRGLRTDVVAIAEAVNYTLIVVCAALLAKGRARGREGVARALLAAGIMFAPSMAASGWLLNDPDHAATVLWVLLALLMIDRGGRRWYVPVLAGLILAWAAVGDSLIEVIGSAPLLLAGVARAVPGLFQRRVRLRERWYELSLAAAGLLSAVVAAAAVHVIAASGGWVALRAGKQFVTSSRLPANAAIEIQYFFELFSANFFGHRVDSAVIPLAVHLAGVLVVALAIWTAVRTVARGFPRGSDFVTDVVLAAIACNMAAYLVLYTANVNQIREVSPVLALGAVLAGRVLGGPLVRNRLEPVLGAGLLAYLLTMGPALTGPAAAPADLTLTGWLQSHGLTSGIAGYWQSNSVTFDSRAKVVVRPVKGGAGGRPVWDIWEMYLPQTDAAHNYANFLVLTTPGPTAAQPPITRAGATKRFGPPARVYHYERYTIMVWNHNLLSSLRLPATL